MGLCKIMKDCYKTDFYCHYCNILCLYFASIYYINGVKNRNKATKMGTFNYFCIKIHHTLFVFENLKIRLNKKEHRSFKLRYSSLALKSYKKLELNGFFMFNFS